MYSFHFFFSFLLCGQKHDVDAVFYPHLINEFHFLMFMELLTTVGRVQSELTPKGFM